MHRETLGVPRVSRCIGLRRRRLAQGLMVPKLRGREGVWGGGEGSCPESAHSVAFALSIIVETYRHQENDSLMRILWQCHDALSAELCKSKSVCLQYSKFKLLSRQTHRLQPHSL